MLLVSVTTAGCADVVVERLEQRDVLARRGREHDQVRFGQHDQIVGGDVYGMEPHRRLEHVLVVDRNYQGGRPQLARREGNRSADQAESDNADLREDRRLALGTTSWLDDREFHLRFTISIVDD